MSYSTYYYGPTYTKYLRARASLHSSVSATEEAGEKVYAPPTWDHDGGYGTMVSMAAGCSACMVAANTSRAQQACSTHVPGTA